MLHLLQFFLPDLLEELVLRIYLCYHLKQLIDFRYYHSLI